MLTDAQGMFTLFFAIYFGMTIGRAHEMYNSWDTYNAWRGQSQSFKRLLAAWIILFAIPLLNFAILYVLLGSRGVPIDTTARGVLNAILIGFSSFFEFGYFRIFEAILNGHPESFFTDEDRKRLEGSGKLRPGFWPHFMPGILYVILSTLMLLIAIYL
jgi:hypothetical protein